MTTNLERCLVLVSRLEVEPGDADELEALFRGGIAWEDLLLDAATFGIQPLLRRHLETPRFRALAPAPVLETLDQAYVRISLKSLQMHGALRRILLAFNTASVQAIPLKGAHLGPSLYGDLALRPMTDIDLLVRAGDRKAAWDQLIALGFRSNLDNPSDKFNSTVDEAVSLQVGHLPALYLDRVCRVELHLNILAENLPPGGDLMGDIWARRIPVTFGEIQAWGLSPEHELLYLCAHLHRHVKAGDAATLLWLCDIHEYLRKYGATLDWKTLDRLAAGRGLTEAVADVLGLLEAHWRTPLPPGRVTAPGIDLDDFLATGRVDPVRKLENAFGAFMWKRLDGVRLAQGPRAKAVYLLGLVFPSRERMAVKYGKRGTMAMVPFYVLHPFLQTGRAIRSLVRNGQRRLRH